MDIKQFEDDIINSICEERYEKSKLVCLSVLKENVANEINEFKIELFRKIKSGYVILNKIYNDKLIEDNSINIPFLEKVFFDRLNDPSYVHSLMEDDSEDEKSISELLGISDESLEKAYALALPIFNEGRYEEASQALFLLNFLYPFCPEFVVMLAHAEYHCGRIKDAAFLYDHAFNLDPVDPAPLRYALFCFNKLDEQYAAEQCFEKIKELEAVLVKQI